MKYVTLTIAGVPVRALFDDCVDHFRIEKAIRESEALKEMETDSIQAGRCEIAFALSPSVRTFDGSPSLMIQAKPEDSIEIEAFLKSKALAVGGVR